MIFCCLSDKSDRNAERGQKRTLEGSLCPKNIPSLTLSHGQVERPLCDGVSPAQDIVYGVGGELGRAWLEHREAAGEGG